MNSEEYGAHLRQIEDELKSKHPLVHTFLGFFYDRGISIELIAAEWPIKAPRDAREFASSLRVLLEKKDVDWESIRITSNISLIGLPDAGATWKWIGKVIKTLEGDVTEEERDFWEKNKNTRPLLGNLL